MHTKYQIKLKSYEDGDNKINEAFPITLHPLLHLGSNSIPQNKSDRHHSSQDTVERESLDCPFSRRLYRTEPRPL